MERVRKELPNDKNTVKSEICWYDEITKEKSRLATKIIVLIVFNTYFPTAIQVFFLQHLEFWSIKLNIIPGLLVTSLCLIKRVKMTKKI